MFEPETTRSPAGFDQELRAVLRLPRHAWDGELVKFAQAFISGRYGALPSPRFDAPVRLLQQKTRG